MNTINYIDQIYNTIEESCKPIEERIYNSVIKEWNEFYETSQRMVKEYIDSDEWNDVFTNFKSENERMFGYKIISQEECDIRCETFYKNHPFHVLYKPLLKHYIGNISELPEKERNRIRKSFSRTHQGIAFDRVYYKLPINEYNELAVKNAKMTVESSRAKLRKSINDKLSKLKIKSVICLYVHESSGGLEGSWVLTLEDDRKVNFSTEIIIAGGYNIQCLHYRYLSKVQYQK